MKESPVTNEKSNDQEMTKEHQKIEEILEYVKHELPESEPRIIDQMRAECKISIAIPAYQEDLEILGPLIFLSRQDAVSKDEYEVIFNVNNRQNADIKTRELNDLTLKVLHCIQNASADSGFLSDQERDIVEQIRNSGLVVHIIDKSTKGNEIKPISQKDFREVGPMQPRKRTMDEICERFILSGKSDGIIASLDADTKVSPKWVRQMIDSFTDSNIKLLAGERRDGLDIDEAGEVVDHISVMNAMLDYWNSDERQKDEVLGEFPKIEKQIQRAEIFLMSHLIDAYNLAREKNDKAGQITAETIKNFRGGSGKAFRVSAYTQHSREIIEMMDTTISELPEDLRQNECQYVGRSESEKVAPTTHDATIEALAIYPETRVRSWQLTSPDSENPYKDFRNLHNPYGSSGKELAYAIVAVLKKRTPTTDWDLSIRSISITQALRLYGRKNPQGRVDNPEKYFFNILSNARMQSVDLENKKLIEAEIAYLFGGREEKLSKMPEKVSYEEAADMYEKLVYFS